MPDSLTNSPIIAAYREKTPGSAALAAVDAWATAALTEGGGDTAAPGLARATVDTLLGVKL